MSNVISLRTDTAEQAECEVPAAGPFGFEDVPPIMSPKTLASVLEVTTLTLQRWRDRKEGPVPTMVPNSNVIRYTRADVITWLGKHRADWEDQS